MKIVFLSNHLIHHQVPFSRYCAKIHEYYFIATKPLPSERKELKYKNYSSTEEPYLLDISTLQSNIDLSQLIDISDIVIIGSAPQAYVNSRIEQKKLVYYYSERLFKSCYSALTLVKNNQFKTRYFLPSKNPKSIMLAASGFLANDLKVLGIYDTKILKWGYFPELVPLDIRETLKKVSKPTLQLLWVGRFLKWKRPFDSIRVLKSLLSKGYNVKLTIIGSGPLKTSIQRLIRRLALEKNVDILDSLPQEEVRKKMIQSNILFVTSNKYEGWGAVVNEGMNSMCAVICSHLVGSAPFLIQNGYKGLIYKCGNIAEMEKKVIMYATNSDFASMISIAAYNTIAHLWNSEIAATRLFDISNKILHGIPVEEAAYVSGPCSLAKPISRNWYKERGK